MRGRHVGWATPQLPIRDIGLGLSYTTLMSSDPHELAAMTEERAREILTGLGAPAGWRERPDWSGLVEQQAIFHKKHA